MAQATLSDVRPMDSSTRARALPTLEALAQAPLPTRFGRFQVRVYRWDDEAAHPALSKEHCALVMGDLHGRRNVPVRVHSESEASVPQPLGGSLSPVPHERQQGLLASV